MTEAMLHFDNLHEAQEVTGSGCGLLAEAEAVFGVRLTARDLWLRLEGPGEGVARAEQYFSMLCDARKHGIWLRPADLRYALQAFKEQRQDALQGLYRARIEVFPGKSPVFPRTFGQARYVEALAGKDLTFGIGPAGTGKTYLAMAMAVQALRQEQVSRIILTRPAIEAGEALGFLPGDMRQKVLPYLRPLYDALYDMMPPEEIERHLERGVIEVAPLAYMRGRTLNHAFIILDEAQNTTREQMLMFLTRLGFDSRCVVTGDPSQVDLPSAKASGLVEARDTLGAIADIAIIELDEADVVRHPLVQKVVQAYRVERSRGGGGADQPAQSGARETR